MGTNIPRPTKRPKTPEPYVSNYTLSNCPNCCAIITGPICEYCGTRFTMTTLEAFEQFQRIAHDLGSPGTTTQLR